MNKQLLTEIDVLEKLASYTLAKMETLPAKKASFLARLYKQINLK